MLLGVLTPALLITSLLCFVIAAVVSASTITQLFFDDFNGTALDTSRWSVVQGGSGIQVTGGVLQTAGAPEHKQIDSIPTFAPMGQSVMARARIRLAGDYQKFGFRVNATDFAGPISGCYFDTLNRSDATMGREHHVRALAWSVPASGSPVNLLDVEIPVTWYEFHEFAIERTPSEVTFSIDGQEVARVADTFGDALPVGVWNDRDGLMQTDWVEVSQISRDIVVIPGCNVADMQALAPTAPWPLTIISATDRPAAPPTPEYCDIVGYVTTNGEGAGPGKAGFEVGIPAPGTWNGKYLFLGNGGLGSGLSLSAGLGGLQKGYAVATTDMGHASDSPFYGNWALLAPRLPNTPALIDFYYRATHQTTLVGKQFVEAYYQKYDGQDTISRSYFQGCSTGGRQGLVEAERYPDDFDGIIAGAPVAGFAHQGPSNTVAEFAFLHPCTAWIPPSLLPAIDAAIYAKCDPNDFGVIQNPLTCSFNPWSLLCNGTNDGSCLTEDQVKGLTRYAAPLLDEHGNVVMPGYPLTDLGAPGGATVMTLGFSQPSCDPTNPEPWTGFTPIHWGASDGTFPYFVFLKESYNQQHFPIGFFRNRGVIDEWALRLNDLRTDLGDATYPERMRRFVAGDGRMILYHGFSDPLITPYQTVQLYKDMASVTHGGYPRLQENVLLFMVPGMLHCGGGPGPNTFDMLAALDEWVEQGKAPDGIIATGSPTPNCDAADTDRTMPLCKFPEVATYKGSGDVCNEANWICNPHNRDLLRLGYDGYMAGLPYSYLSHKRDRHEDEDCTRRAEPWSEFFIGRR